MKRRWRHYALCALIAIASSAAARLLSGLRFFEILNLKALDAQFVLRGRQPVRGFMVVLIDQKALQTFPELRIFWHPYYAQTIRAAGEAGAKMIVLDLAFGVPVEKWEPDYDRMMAEAVSASPVPVVCAYASTINVDQRADPVPINMLAGALGLAGFANITSDPDDFIRRQELIEESGTARSLAMRAAEKSLGLDAEEHAGRLTLAGKPVPIARDRSIFINYAGPADTFPHVSLADVVAAARAGNKDQLRRWFDGNIVMVGSDTPDDRYPTPFYTMLTGARWITPGVEIQANTIRTLLTGDYLVPAPEWARIAALLAVSGATAAIAFAASAGFAAFLLILETLAIVLFTQLMFRAGVILYSSEMLVAAAVCAMGAVVYRFWTAEQRGRLFHRAVSLFVGKELAASLDDSETIGLTGKRETVTILFTDIRGFTAFSEKISDEQGPEVLVQLLNEYLAAMVAVIVRYRGQVNKFIGDGILAVFSDDDHALRAVNCATEMVSAPGRFETGAGVHSGMVVVGNVGSADKMEYTVLGDTVNLASRLESLNKEHHTQLLMSGATESLLRGRVATTQLGSVAVRGKTAPIPLYTVTALLSLKNVAKSVTDA
jgi:adenylate cyclase